MSRSSHAWRRLVNLYALVFRRNRIANALRFSYRGGVPFSPAPRVENLEPRLLLSAADPTETLAPPVEVHLADTAVTGLDDDDLALAGGVGDVVGIDVSDAVASEQYRLVGAHLEGEGWVLDLQPHGGDIRLVHDGDVIATLITPESLGGAPFAASGRIYLAPSIADGLAGDASADDLGFQGVIRLSLEAGESGSAAPIDVTVTVGAGAADSGPNVPVQSGEAAILRAQQRLNYLAAAYPGLGLTELTLSGVLDTSTRAALQAFQTAAGLTADGVLGEQTADHLASYPDAPVALSDTMRRMLADAADGAGLLGGVLDGLDALSAAIPLLGGERVTGPDGDASRETVSLDTLFRFADLLHTHVVVPVNAYLAEAVSPTLEGLAGVLNALGLQATATQIAAGHVMLSARLADTAQFARTLTLTSMVSELTGDTDVEFDVTVSAEYALQFTLDVDLGRGATAAQAVHVRLDEFSAGLSVETSDLAGTIPLGFIDGRIVAGTAGNELNAHIDAEVAITGGLGATTSLGALNSGWLAGSVTVTPAGSIDVNLPLALDIPGLLSVDAGLRLTDANLFQAPDPQVQVRWDGSFQPAGLIPDELTQFLRISAGEVVSALRELSEDLNTLSQLPMLRIPLPFADGRSVSDYLRFSDTLIGEVIDRLESEPNIPSFRSAGQLQAAVPGISNLRYERSFQMGGEDIPVLLWDFSLFESLAPQLVNLNLGALSAGSLAGLAANGAVNLAAQLDMGFTLGIDLRPLGQAFSQGAINLDANDDGSVTPADAVTLGALVGDDRWNNAVPAADGKADLELTLLNGAVVPVNFDGLRAGSTIWQLRDRINAAVAAAGATGLVECVFDADAARFVLRDYTDAPPADPSAEGEDAVTEEAVFAARAVNGTLGAIILGLVGQSPAADQSGWAASAEIAGNPLHNDAMNKHVFIQDAHLQASIDLTGTFTGTGRLGLIDLNLGTAGNPAQATIGTYVNIPLRAPWDASAGNPSTIITLADFQKQLLLMGKSDEQLAAMGYSDPAAAPNHALDDLDMNASAQLELPVEVASTVPGLSGTISSAGVWVDWAKVYDADWGFNINEATLFDASAPADGELRIRLDGFEEIEQLVHMGIDNLRDLLYTLLDVVENNLANLDVMRAKIPGLNRSLYDLVQFAQSIRQQIETAVGQADPQAAINALLDQLGLELQGIETIDGEQMLRIGWNYAAAALFDQLPLNLSLVGGGAVADADGPVSGFGSAIETLLGIEGNASVALDADVSFSLNLGFSLEDPGMMPRIFSDSAISATLGVAAADLQFQSMIGPVGVRVGSSSNPGTFILDADGLPGGAPAGITIGLDDSLSSYALSALSSGDFTFDLNAVGRLELPIDALAADQQWAPLDPANPELRIRVDLDGILDPGTELIEVLATPSADSVAGLLAGLNFGDWDAFDVSDLVAALDTVLDVLDAALGDSIMEADIPLIGTNLANIADFVERLRAAIDDPAGSVVELRQLLFSVLGPGDAGATAGWLLDYNGDGQITIDDVPVVGDADHIQFNLKLGAAETVTFVDGQLLDIGADALGLDLAGSVVGTIEFGFELGFGISRDLGVYFDVSSPEDLYLAVNTDVDFAASGDLGFLSLDVTARDADSRSEQDKRDAYVDAQGDGVDFTGRMNQLDARISIDLTDALVALNPASPDGKLTFAELSAGNPMDVVDTEINLSAAAHLELMAGIAHNDQFPSIRADLYLLWTYGPETGYAIASPVVQFTDVGLDLGQFVGNVLGEVLNTIGEVVAPVAPIVEILTTPIPVISDLGSPVTLLDLADLFGYGDYNDFIYAVDTVLDLIELVNNVSSRLDDAGLVLPIGSFTFNGHGPEAPAPPVSGPGEGQEPYEYILGNSVTRFAWGDGSGQGASTADLAGAVGDVGDPDVSELLARAGGIGSGGSPGFDDQSGFSFPLLSNPLQVLQLLMGREDIDLVRYDLPRFQIDFAYSQAFTIIGPLMARITGTVGAVIDFAFGYDTQGFFDMARSGDPTDLLNGLYLADVDPTTGREVRELELYGSLAASGEVNVGIARGGAGGGIYLGFYLDLNDPNDDGRVRLGELWQSFMAGPQYIFDFGGVVEAFLNAYVKVGFGPLSWEKNWELARITLVEFEFSAPDPVEVNTDPILAGFTDETAYAGVPAEEGLLVINVGDHAAHRYPNPQAGDQIDTDDGNDLVVIERGYDANEIFVTSMGFRQRYTGVQAIRIQGGAGNDTIEIEDGITLPVYVDGGAGDDRITTSRGAAAVFGGEGNDTIVLGTADGNVVDAGAGDDRVIGSTRDDEVHGGAGNDVIDGDLGDDRLYGGEGDDQILGGRGNDTIVGGAGDDAIDGGIGNDRIWGDYDAAGGPGEDGADRIEGGSENDLICGGGANDVINGGRGNDTIAGDAGDDAIHGDSGNDTLYGGAGGDTLYGDGGSDSLYGQDGNDTLIAGIAAQVGSPTYVGDAETTHVLDGGAGNDWIYGDLGTDTVNAGDGDNTVMTFAGNDEIRSGSGNDYIDAGAGDDVITVTGGNNTIYGREGSETVSTGAGNDWIDLRSAAAEPSSTHTVTSAGGDNVIHTDDGDDAIATGAGNDTIHAGHGVHTIHSGAGDDTITAGDGEHRIYASAPGAVDADRVTLGDGPAVIDTGAGNDTILAGDGDKTITAGAGDDVVATGTGDDWIEGGDGNDRVTSTGGDNVVLAGAGNDEIVTGPGSDWIVGAAGNDRISSGGGNDVVFGGEGIFAFGDLEVNDPTRADFTFPPRFADAQGDPVTRVEGLELPLITPKVTGGSSIDGSLDGEDWIEAGDGDDVVFGGGMADRISGGSGNDYLDGGAGEDTLWGEGSHDVLVGGANADVLYGGEGIDNLYGNAGDDVLMGDAGDAGQRLYGGAGDDRLYAWATTPGAVGDQLFGDEGNDWLYGNIASEIFFGGSGNDNVFGDYLSGPLYGLNLLPDTVGGDDVMFGDAGEEILYGGAGDDILWGGANSDVLEGQGGTDTMYGGEGIDIIVVETDPARQAAGTERFDGHGGNRFLGDAADDNATDILRAYGTMGDDVMWFRENTPGVLTVTIQTGGGPVRAIDAVWRDADGSALVEQFQLSGLAGNDVLGFVNEGPGAVDFSDINTRGRDWVGVIYGGGGDDVLHGTTGRDRLLGDSGSDTLYGYDGDDRLFGDMGPGDGPGVVDRLFAGAGNDDLIGGHGRNELYAWTRDPAAGGQFGVFIDPATGRRYDNDGGGQYVRESTGLNRMLGRDRDDVLYGGTGLDFLYGGEGEDALIGWDGQPFNEGLDGGDDAWKDYARQTDRVWYYSGTAAADRIEVNYVTEPGLLTQHHIITRLTNNNGNYTFDAQVRLDFLARDAEGEYIWDPTDLMVDLTRLQDEDPDVRALAYTELVLTGSLLPSEGDFDAIIIDALGGDDEIYVGPTVRKTVWIDAGAGDDFVEIASGNAILPDATENNQRNDIYAQPANAAHAWTLTGTTAVCLGDDVAVTGEMDDARLTLDIKGMRETLSLKRPIGGATMLSGVLAGAIDAAGLGDDLEVIVLGGKVILRTVDAHADDLLSLTANLAAFAMLPITGLRTDGTIVDDRTLRSLRGENLKAQYGPDRIGHSIRWSNLTIDSPDDVDWYTLNLLAVGPDSVLRVTGQSDLDQLNLALFQTVGGVMTQLATSAGGEIALDGVSGLDVTAPLHVQVRQAEPLPT
ncbi:MAG: LEPR-XLL domain-containing protein, partial [Planctomycetes bacterium]|nr:LEPR-XLL domain-containing protein [Planctomycetota bacterium]